MLTRNDIKANVMFDWNHHNCKFLPGLHAIVNDEVNNNDYNSNRRRSFQGKRGKVIAVSSPDGKRIRGDQRRMYTTYYVEFANKEVCGFDSGHLDLPKENGEYKFGVID